MPASSPQALNTLVQQLVPRTRTDDRLKSDLAEVCRDILNSHIGHAREPDVAVLSELIKRQIAQTSHDPNASIRFSNLLARLMEQSVLSRKQSVLHFLQSIGPAPRPTSVTPSAFLPSLRVPPAPRSRASRVPSPEPQPVPEERERARTQAEILRDYRARIGRSHLPEHLLLRDTLFLLQGISGKYVRFAETRPYAEDRDEARLVFVDDPNQRFIIPSPTRTLILRISELGHLYIRVSSFVREREGKPGVGMIEQSLCHYLQTQLTEYYRLVAVLESQMAHSTADNQRDDGLTLRRLEVWIDEWRLKMRMMATCVEGCEDSHGGALVSLIHGHTSNGDPFVRTFTNELLEEVSKPFFEILQKWLFAGELHDPYGEFFVAIDPEMAHLHQAGSDHNALSADGGFGGGGGMDDDVQREEGEGGLRLWQSKYIFSKDMLPSFVGEAFGKKIFSTGRTLNFIRYTCQDSDWVATRNKMSNADRNLQYSDIAALERSIDDAFRIANQRLFDVFIDKFKLMDHVRALKMYLLLGQGDFVEQLMEALAPNLARPANTLYRHNLTATLEAAVRASNAAQAPSDVLRRLDVRMLAYTHGELGWDVFTLEYKVDAPLDTIVDPEATTAYLRVFNHLWRLKRIERALSEGWTRVIGGARTFLRVPEHERDWHQTRIVLAEMIHFVRQLQAYCQLEVIECSYKALVDFVQKKEGDLDALIEAHRTYLDRVTKKILLISPKAGKEEYLLGQLREIFEIILQFRDATDAFYGHTLTEAARRDGERDAERGIHVQTDTLPAPRDDLKRAVKRIKEYASAFSEHAQAIVHGCQTHPDLDCRFLAIRLNFSDFYRSKKDKS
ncbi:gamma-tubulin complex, component 3 [Exidia glandulosa HHB12029]|uniref:Gamma-tubulin complex, component 3 n=1 Tax=Exidia glandulosa HHB12029 TaxID=1314781 RepID=A0A165R150_EXIGL|nr:gamma-tubulin complex, component 3 [Exidia glandulosa HHB12029]